MSEIKLPAIIKYAMHNHIALRFENGHAYHLDGEFKGEWSDDYYIDHTARNHTTEYLANTYGEVKSKEHAEFIETLCEVNKINVSDVYRESHKFFAVIGNGLLFFNHAAIPSKDGRKQITIPLPPECESVDEWPKVNDEVLFHPNPSQPEKIKATIKYIGEKFTILQSKSGREFSRRNAKLLIEKPKTPEQELFEDFWREVGLFMNRSNLNKKIFESAFINNIAKSRNSG